MFLAKQAFDKCADWRGDACHTCVGGHFLDPATLDCVGE